VTETIPGIKKGRKKESSGGGESNYDTANATIYPHPAQQ
jgi:hypothetical protein